MHALTSKLRHLNDESTNESIEQHPNLLKRFIDMKIRVHLTPVKNSLVVWSFIIQNWRFGTTVENDWYSRGTSNFVDALRNQSLYRNLFLTKFHKPFFVLLKIPKHLPCPQQPPPTVCLHEILCATLQLNYVAQLAYLFMLATSSSHPWIKGGTFETNTSLDETEFSNVHLKSESFQYFWVAIITEGSLMSGWESVLSVPESFLSIFSHERRRRTTQNDFYRSKH